jgi:hypothetical protein
MIQTVLVDYIAAGFDNKSTSFSIKNLSALQLTPSLFTFFHFRAWFGSTRKSTHPSSFFCMKRSNLGPVILFTSRTSPGRFTVKCSRPSRSEGPQLSAKLQKKKREGSSAVAFPSHVQRPADAFLSTVLRSPAFLTPRLLTRPPGMEPSYNFGPYKIDAREVFHATPLSYAMVNLGPLLPGNIRSFVPSSLRLSFGS